MVLQLLVCVAVLLAPLPNQLFHLYPRDESPVILILLRSDHLLLKFKLFHLFLNLVDIVLQINIVVIYFVKKRINFLGGLPHDFLKLSLQQLLFVLLLLLILQNFSVLYLSK